MSHFKNFCEELCEKSKLLLNFSSFVSLEGCNGNETKEDKIKNFCEELCEKSKLLLNYETYINDHGKYTIMFGVNGMDGCIDIQSFNDPTTATHPSLAPCVNISFVERNKTATDLLNHETFYDLCKKHFGGSSIDVGARHRAACKRDNILCVNNCRLCSN